jgi:hypothetical protein
MVSGKKERGYLPSNIMPGLRITILVRKKNEKKPMISKQTARIERRLATRRIRDVKKNSGASRRTRKPRAPNVEIDMEPFGTCERKWATMHASPFNHNNADHNLRRRNARGDKIKR